MHLADDVYRQQVEKALNEAAVSANGSQEAAATDGLRPTTHELSCTALPVVERVSAAFREAQRLAGIKRRITFHGLRHGFCSKLAEAGKPLYVIKEAARHADVSTSLIYVHTANEHLKNELDDVFG